MDLTDNNSKNIEGLLERKNDKDLTELHAKQIKFFLFDKSAKQELKFVYQKEMEFTESKKEVKKNLAN